jgi:hypothetical protein
VLSPAIVAAIHAHNLVSPPPVSTSQTVAPLSGTTAAQMAAAGRGSGVIDPTRTGTDPAVVGHLQQQFSGPGVAGFNFLSALLGRPLAYRVPGVTPPIGYHPSTLGTAADVASLLPTLRLVRAGLAARAAVLAGASGEEAGQAARASMSLPGPSEQQLWPKLAKLPMFQGRSDQRVLRFLAGNPQAGPVDEWLRQVMLRTDSAAGRGLNRTMKAWNTRELAKLQRARVQAAGQAEAAAAGYTQRETG